MKKRYYVCGILAAALPLIYPTAQAGYVFSNGALSGEATLDLGAANIISRHVNFGTGRVDIRNGENTGTSATWQEGYLKPGLTLNYQLNDDWALVGGGSVVSATTLGDGDAGGFSRSSDSKTAVEELYAGVHYRQWTLTLGRQNFMVGNGFIVMDGNLDFLKDGAYWLGPRSAFRDAAVLSWDNKTLQAQAFSLRTDSDLGDFRLTGANVDYNLNDQVTLGAMALGVATIADSSQSTQRDGMRVYDLRALHGVLPGVPNLTLNAEMAWQKGSNSTTEYDATAWYLQGDYQFASLPLQPTIGYRYASFSGDDDLTDNTSKAWDPLSKGFIDWGTWLIGDVVGNYLMNNSNENVHQLSAKLQLNDAFTLGAMHYQFWLDKNNFLGTAVENKHFADESVVYLDYAPNAQLYSSLSYNWVKPQAAAKEFFGDDKPFSAIELYFTYKY